MYKTWYQIEFKVKSELECYMSIVSFSRVELGTLLNLSNALSTLGANGDTQSI
jgi:hypothetical protein